MRGKIISKIILVLIMGVVLFVNPTHVFATSGGAEDLSQFWEDQGTLEDLEGETNTDTSTDTNTNTDTSTDTNTDTNTNTNEYNKAGIAEDTMMVVTLVALGAIAVFANKKVNEYKNI